ncbi:tyrosine-type recombinase/integrase [uncultured Traorella sp.]|uniref:tyrosine-type recombinase/integrase n=1 Tax=uncultured Traorella sp. TaxID=1929048 RepID=UPI0025E4D1C2|nr:tyrosine-type recombinase/integrase [uncultured Traorella sp.]
MKLERKHLCNYLEECENKRLSMHTLKAYRIDLNQYYDYMGMEKLEDDKAGLVSYIRFLNERYEAKTVKRKLASLHAYFCYGEYEDLIDINPLRKIRYRIKEEKSLPKTIATDHLKQLFASMSYSGKERDIAILDILISTGIRVSELCSLKKEDVDLHEGMIRVHGKGKKERVIYLGEKVVHSLKNYEKIQKKSEYYFTNKYDQKMSEQSIRNLIHKAGDHAQISTPMTPHMFRHTFASLLLQEEVDIRNIQYILGHSSITTTQIYTHISNNQQKKILIDKNPRNLI